MGNTEKFYTLITVNKKPVKVEVEGNSYEIKIGDQVLKAHIYRTDNGFWYVVDDKTGRAMNTMCKTKTSAIKSMEEKKELIEKIISGPRYKEFISIFENAEIRSN